MSDVDDFATFHQFRDELIRNEFRLSVSLKRSTTKFLYSAKRLWITQRLLQAIQQNENIANMKNYNYYKSRFWKHMSENNAVFVSIHICQGDYAERMVKTFHGQMVSKFYFTEAMNWFREKVIIISWR